MRKAQQRRSRKMTARLNRKQARQRALRRWHRAMVLRPLGRQAKSRMARRARLAELMDRPWVRLPERRMKPRARPAKDSKWLRRAKDRRKTADSLHYAMALQAEVMRREVERLFLLPMLGKSFLQEMMEAAERPPEKMFRIRETAAPHPEIPAVRLRDFQPTVIGIDLTNKT